MWRASGLSSFLAPSYLILLPLKLTLSYDRHARWLKDFSMLKLILSAILTSNYNSLNLWRLLMGLNIIFKFFKFMFIRLILSASCSKFFFIPHAFIKFTISGNYTLVWLRFSSKLLRLSKIATDTEYIFKASFSIILFSARLKGQACLDPWSQLWHNKEVWCSLLIWSGEIRSRCGCQSRD